MIAEHQEIFHTFQGFVNNFQREKLNEFYPQLHNIPKNTLSKLLIEELARPQHHFFIFFPSVVANMPTIASFPRDIHKKIRRLWEKVESQHFKPSPSPSPISSPEQNSIHSADISNESVKNDQADISLTYSPEYQSILQLLYVLRELKNTDYNTGPIIDKIEKNFFIDEDTFQFYLQAQCIILTSEFAEQYPEKFRAFEEKFQEGQILIAEMMLPLKPSDPTELTYQLPETFNIEKFPLLQYSLYFQQLIPRRMDPQFIEEFLEDQDELFFPSAYSAEVTEMNDFILMETIGKAKKKMLSIQKRIPNWRENPHFLTSIAFMYYNLPDSAEVSEILSGSKLSGMMVEKSKFLTVLKFAQMAVDQSMLYHWDRFNVWKGFAISLVNLGLFHSALVISLGLLQMEPRDFDLLITCGQCAYQLSTPYELYLYFASILDFERFSLFMEEYWILEKTLCHDEPLFTEEIKAITQEFEIKFRAIALMIFTSSSKMILEDTSVLEEIIESLPFIRIRDSQDDWISEDYLPNGGDDNYDDEDGDKSKNLKYDRISNEAKAIIEDVFLSAFRDVGDVENKKLFSQSFSSINPPHLFPPSIYQLKISIRNAKPTIWRRILIRSDSSLEDLHDFIQEIFNWGGYHLHQFIFTNKQPFQRTICIGSIQDREEQEGPIVGYGDFEYYEDELTIEQILGSERKTISYLYDFGDNWDHKIQLETTYPLDVNEGIYLPICIKAVRMAPLEDFGGIFNFSRFLQYLQMIEENQSPGKRGKSTPSKSTKSKRKPIDFNQEEQMYFHDILQQYGKDLDWKDPGCDVVSVKIDATGHIVEK